MDDTDHFKNHGSAPGTRKHIFFASSITEIVAPESEPTTPRSAFRDAFIKRKASVSSLNLNATPTERSFPFSFDLPRGARTGEEMPPSFTGSREPGPSSGAVDITYKVKVTWEPSNVLESPSILEAPILFQPDQDFQSIDASPENPQSWLEMPLRSDRPIPFRCAVSYFQFVAKVVVTLPTSVTFSRPSAIPYFVVFTTTPRSPELAKEIAADATISVSLLRQVTVTEHGSSLPTPPHTPPSSSEESDTPRQSKLLRRVARSNQSRLSRAVKVLEEDPDLRDKPLPRIPIQTVFTESSTLQNSICIGFPKRPRQQLVDIRGHPSLDSHAALPDGLHKSKISLHKEMLPCINWAGLSVKYYLDVSVLIGQDDLRARVPVRII
ncbi:hypothetical protein H0H81_007241 [Sphagnurus paluster]|uniref:Uncharacterized protein n=1 Tax=Sphagnurus paluster TaxID=117069 RepID=A0A9P7GQW2_9AGAR|nr:hypothetical protein H0H81_007241 [Sphagnurus paluster]